MSLTDYLCVSLGANFKSKVNIWIPCPTWCLPMCPWIRQPLLAFLPVQQVLTFRTQFSWQVLSGSLLTPSPPVQVGRPCPSLVLDTAPTLRGVYSTNNLYKALTPLAPGGWGLLLVTLYIDLRQCLTRSQKMFTQWLTAWWFYHVT